VIVQGAAGSTLTSPNLLRVGPLDHRALFPRSALVIHHGGAGTVHAACAAGVPSVVVPHVGDQLYWADRLHALGVAPAPVPLRRLTSEHLAEVAIGAALDRGLHDRARALAVRLRAEDGVASAVALLEALRPA